MYYFVIPESSPGTGDLGTCCTAEVISLEGESGRYLSNQVCGGVLVRPAGALLC